MAKDMAVSPPFQSGLPEVKADEGKLYKVFSNLYDNALKYTEDGGEIRVSSRRSDDGVVLEFKDNGIGIDEEEIQYVFDRYKRMTTAQTRKIKGTGLGLAIVKQIVTAHGGRIWVESAAGEGCTFSVELGDSILPEEKTPGADTKERDALV